MARLAVSGRAVGKSPLQAFEAPPSRACHLDMPRLLDRLGADRFRAEPRWASIHCALQLLDF